MKRFKFTMDSLLTVREHAKHEAARALNQATRKRQELEEMCAQALRSTEQMERDLVRCLVPSGRASEVIVRQNALSFHRGEARRLDESLAKAREDEEQARDRVLVAQQEEEALVRLRSKRRDEYRAELDREDELAALEFVNARRT